MLKPSASDIVRFEKFISIEPNSGCWLWTGAANADLRGIFGYGGRRPKGVTASSHRFSYLIWKGDPGHLHVLHRCDVPLCVNPDHLFLGTHADNMQDMVKKKRHKLVNIPLENHIKTHCLHGHSLAGSNLWIRADGARICKSCRARIARNWRKNQ